MFSRIGSRKLIIGSSCLCALAVVAAAVMVTSPIEKDDYQFSEIGYQLGSTVVSERFTAPSIVDLSTNGNSTDYDYTEEGLLVTLKQNTSALNIDVPSTTANAMRLMVNVSAVDNVHYLDIRTAFKVKATPSWYYGIDIQLTPGQVQLVPEVWLGEGTPRYQNYVFKYDVQAKGSIDLVVYVDQGIMVVGVDGFEKRFQTDYKKFSDLHFDGISITTSSSRWFTSSDIVVRTFELGNSPRITYHDNLHRTITPWGYDFTLAIQLHADSANPAQLTLMKALADRYGVKGEFNGWMTVMNSSEQYSIGTHPDYTAALHALKGSGWDIGLHAVTQDSSTRTELLGYLQQFEQEFGPLGSWVDHGEVSQDLWRLGNDPSSDYYISDWLVENDVMIWVNEENHSHSSVHDLNLDSMMYHHGSFPGLDLQKVSSTGFLEETNNWQDTFAPATRDEQSDRQRVYAANNAVLVWHEYTWRFVYVEDGGVSYARQSHANMGYPYVAIEYEEYENANVHPDGTWYLKPVVEQYFAALNEDYQVWYATPHQVYDRSIVVQQLAVEENDTSVVITNPTTTDVDGFTLYTKEKPLYCLISGGTSHYPRTGAESYQFVVPEVPAGSSIVLTKAKLPSYAPGIADGPIVSAWGDQDTLYLKALKDGNESVALGLGSGQYVILDMTVNQEMTCPENAPITLTEGHLYRISKR